MTIYECPSRAINTSRAYFLSQIKKKMVKISHVLQTQINYDEREKRETFTGGWQRRNYEPVSHKNFIKFTREISI